MKLLVAAIGLLKSGAEKELAAGYEARIKATGKQVGISALLIKDWAESRLADAAQRTTAEAVNLWSLVPEATPVVVLDERGGTMSSESFARFLGQQADNGAKQLTFMIGGPDGHAPETRAKATKLLGFGPMTFPHRLVRVMLLEQIYRSVTILVNHPYHRK